ncbi:MULTISPECIES: glucans biosynthesis glucosyltransferase MdoH [Pseudomonas syringae group]|uniref:glucans biosynthesis glucosyltransferase MdoH n=1 Tax=Pseudomonas syringae group TaxID=136849 RepID=UPI000EFE6D49|nr:MULTISPECIES: glucans biosynthesis glucosyltransferase MdoH [Pseudomonas syringae group]MCF5713038.1 glucans biosynthesis glucosyltransferase MdoH [Pseudomonas tremae]MCF5745057.1 glucans biosynthesis glucosyltransferase MdoH [Pseudomonas tremae]RMP31861.1 Glucans biosynthesis glucosyltransferase H [Pseudomonas coronafaciens pv. atropurpurea]UQB31172.1 glucans biosynthesis glucosyltransferase MdoH [Pseudomonas tremae]UQB36237.1 glucans biosynthesis glucosyltransferase MdoH [Pseudomonas trem
MSNSQLVPVSLNEYLAHLPMSDEQRAELASCKTFAELHERLSAQPLNDPSEAAQASVGRRLTLSADDLEDAEMLGVDASGRLCLKATPPIRRTKVVPEPWRTNILVRGWRRLTGKTNPPKPDHDDLPRDLPKSRWRTVGSIRRYILLILMLGQTIVAGWYMKGILPYQGWSLVSLDEITRQTFVQTALQVMPYALQTSILLLFGILFCWVSAGFWTALMGFLELLTGRDKYRISGASAGNEPIEAGARTALVMPICNEDVPRVFAGLRATFESVAATGNLDRFDFFVLSDTNETDIAVAEQQAWLDVCRETKGFGSIFYRRRRRRVKRKSGNLDDFCRRWGGEYRYMVVLDADSVMSGECLTSLVRLMEATPDAGIIQTAPRASGMDTLYARMQQFATRVYGPLFTAGLHFWQLGESHYWGHNAIIRMKPFIEHCALAPLPGKGAFAGAILSHDFVEAALMRRAGWGVWIAYDLPGSYEELPPNLLDELKRDRRWCHGNLMNFRLFLVKGMHPVHRAVFLTGVMSYLSAPLWFFFLVLSTALLAVNTLMEPTYFLEPRQLYPLWPQWHPEKAVALFSTTIVLLFLPKLLSVILIWAKGAKGFGGKFKVTVSMLLEMLFSVLLAPVRMLFHTRFVLAAFLGWAATWNSPQRDDDSTPWIEAVKRHGPQTLLGACWALLVFWLNPSFLWWLAPIVVSLMLSIPVSVISSRTGLGLKARDEKFFLIPEEFEPPQELISTDHYTHENRWHALKQGFIRAVVDPRQNALACALATSRHRQAQPIEVVRMERVDHALKVGPAKLSNQERLMVLSDPVALGRLHERVWSEGHEEWLAAWRASIEADPHAPLLPLQPLGKASEPVLA